MTAPQNLSDPQLEKKTARSCRITHIFSLCLHLLERVIAALTIVVLVIALGTEIYRMFTVDGYFADVHACLESILTIVVGMEFVRTLIDTTPASILEVLTVAITRYVILNHDDALSNVACIACIAGLFAIRRFLVPRGEPKKNPPDPK